MEYLNPELHVALRVIAARAMAKESADHTMQPTELAHEAFFRLLQQKNLKNASREKVLAAAAITMRRLLIDYARSTARRKSLKYKGDPSEAASEFSAKSPGQIDVLAVAEAMQKLAGHSKRLAKIVECRVFARMTGKEIAAVMELSVSTIEHQWGVAKKWLHNELRHNFDEDPAGAGQSAGPK